MSINHLLNKRLLIFLLTIVVSAISIFRVLPNISVAQSTTRKFEIQIPKHLPIKVQLKKDKETSLKEMKNEKWLRDFELEVENIGTKPIFFLHLMVIFPDIRTEGNDQIMFPLYYGRPEIGDIKTKAAPSDVPIKPGETYVFKIFPSQIPAWESNVQEKKYSEPEKVQIVFEILSFGDGTGFAGTDGIALPHKIDQAKQCPGPDSRGKPESTVDVTIKSSEQPASFLPVKFLSGDSDVPAVLKLSESTRTTPDSCCTGWDCEYIIFNTANICLNCTAQTQIEDVFCSYEFGFCRHVTYGSGLRSSHNRTELQRI